MRLATIILDAPLEILVERVNARARAAETEGAGILTEYLQKLQDAHHALYAQTPGAVLVDATRDKEEVSAHVCKAIGQLRGGAGSPASVMEL